MCVQQTFLQCERPTKTEPCLVVLLVVLILLVGYYYYIVQGFYSGGGPSEPHSHPPSWGATTVIYVYLVCLFNICFR